MFVLTADEIAKKLRDSLEATANGLRQVGQSVRASGFADALPGYQQMRSVLIAQRMWSLREGRRELEVGWREVATAARDVAEILKPFTDAMQAISGLDESPLNGSPRKVLAGSLPVGRPSTLLASAFDPPKDDDQILLEALQSGPIAHSRLGARLGWSKDRLDAALNRFATAGRIATRRYGRGMRIRAIGVLPR